MLHRLDPRVKLVVTLLLVLGITLTPARAWPAYPLLWALVASLAAFGGESAARLAWRARVVLPFVLVAVPLLVTTPGPPITEAFGMAITGPGAERFAAVALKSWLSVQAALLLARTTRHPDLLWALGALRVPGTLVQIIGFMLRYLSTLQDEAARLMRARAARSATLPGGRSRGSLVWRARVAGGMVGGLFLRSTERAERVHAAMASRGYAGELRALAPPPLHWRAVAWGMVPVGVLIGIEALAVLWWSG